MELGNIYGKHRSIVYYSSVNKETNYFNFTVLLCCQGDRGGTVVKVILYSSEGGRFEGLNKARVFGITLATRRKYL
jgi:hypothetical protein